ncbi:DUF4286 family protein [Dysgonomonas capnocytophagoides]|uniref:DUF4286 family protein n=1 Tax=Dysgonomonas capnocytophagoides TaxID=45254 RepID=UPI002920C36A|nr:DUF4286 family protein [Dysgonomonas capnocytophagoides]
MLIFNTTLHIDDSIHDECLIYLKERYIPKAIESKILEQPLLAKIEAQHEEHGVSYAMQFKTTDIDTLDSWAKTTGQELQQEMNNRFGSKIAGFVTLLEEIPL